MKKKLTEQNLPVTNIMEKKSDVKDTKVSETVVNAEFKRKMTIEIVKLVVLLGLLALVAFYIYRHGYLFTISA